MYFDKRIYDKRIMNFVTAPMSLCLKSKYVLVYISILLGRFLKYIYIIKTYNYYAKSKVVSKVRLTFQIYRKKTYS